MLPRTAAGRRTALAALALVLAIAGASLMTASYGNTLFSLSPPVLAAWCLPPAIGVLLHGWRAQRWACLLGTVVTALPTLVLFFYGGVYLLPSVVALGLVVTATDRSTPTKIGWIVFAVVCVFIARTAVLIVLSPAD